MFAFFVPGSTPPLGLIVSLRFANIDVYHVMIQCLIVLFLTCGISAAGQCEEGNWVTQAPWEQPYHAHYARTGYVINESYSFELFHSRSCPTQPLFYSCYYRDSRRSSLRNIRLKMDCMSMRNLQKILCGYPLTRSSVFSCIRETF